MFVSFFFCVIEFGNFFIYIFRECDYFVDGMFFRNIFYSEVLFRISFII